MTVPFHLPPSFQYLTYYDAMPFREYFDFFGGGHLSEVAIQRILLGAELASKDEFITQLDALEEQIASFEDTLTGILNDVISWLDIDKFPIVGAIIELFSNIAEGLITTVKEILTGGWTGILDAYDAEQQKMLDKLYNLEKGFQYLADVDPNASRRFVWASQGDSLRVVVNAWQEGDGAIRSAAKAAWSSAKAIFEGRTPAEQIVVDRLNEIRDNLWPQITIFVDSFSKGMATIKDDLAVRMQDAKAVLDDGYVAFIDPAALESELADLGIEGASSIGLAPLKAVPKVALGWVPTPEGWMLPNGQLESQMWKSRSFKPTVFAPVIGVASKAKQIQNTLIGFKTLPTGKLLPDVGSLDALQGQREAATRARDKIAAQREEQAGIGVLLAAGVGALLLLRK